MEKAILGLREKAVSVLQLTKSLKAHTPCAPPVRVQVELTNRCNLKCIMCDRWKWISEEKNTRDELSIAKLSELFTEFKVLGVREVLLTGGETMLRKDFIDIIQNIKNLGIKVSLITNGTMVTDEIASALARIDAKITFSIDGDMEAHDLIRGVKGTFNRATNGIAKIVKAYEKESQHGELEINYTVQKNNIHKIVPFFQAIYNTGIQRVLLTMVHGSINTALDADDIQPLKTELSKLHDSKGPKLVIGEALKLFADSRLSVADVKSGHPVLGLFKDKPVPCFAAYKTSFIDCSGNVFPCCYCYLDNADYTNHEEERQTFCLGNIHEDSFTKIWRGNVGGYKKFRRNSDPVDINKSICCGQCLEYFQFKKINKFYNGINAVPFIFNMLTGRK